MTCFKDIIDELERDLTGDVDVLRLARRAGMSLYEFRRIFSFVARISLGEYVRRRRLSLAAIELCRGDKSVGDVAARYGYESPSAFSRAFKEQHGVTPTEALRGNRSFHLLTRLDTAIVTTGGEDVAFTLLSEDALTVSGFSAVSPLSDTECCEDVWEGFYRSPLSERLCRESDTLYAVYENGENEVRCLIGTRDGKEGDAVCIPKSEWVSFRLSETGDAYVNRIYNEIFSAWLLSAGYERNGTLPNLEIYPSDMSKEGFSWEIRIPVKRMKGYE